MFLPLSVVFQIVLFRNVNPNWTALVKHQVGLINTSVVIANLLIVCVVLACVKSEFIRLFLKVEPQTVK